MQPNLIMPVTNISKKGLNVPVLYNLYSEKSFSCFLLELVSESILTEMMSNYISETFKTWQDVIDSNMNSELLKAVLSSTDIDEFKTLLSQDNVEKRLVKSTMLDLKKESWIETDPDSIQRYRKLSESSNLYELIQANIVSCEDTEEDLYKVSHTLIDIADYSNEELNEFLKMYGYNTNVKDFVSEYTTDAYRLIAEMIFETSSYEYFVTEALSLCECESYINQITGTL